MCKINKICIVNCKNGVGKTFIAKYVAPFFYRQRIKDENIRLIQCDYYDYLKKNEFENSYMQYSFYDLNHRRDRRYFFSSSALPKNLQ